MWRFVRGTYAAPQRAHVAVEAREPSAMARSLRLALLHPGHSGPVAELRGLALSLEVQRHDLAQRARQHVGDEVAGVGHRADAELSRELRGHLAGGGQR